jgi:hypothetical protein
VRSAWPTREVAVFETFARCGVWVSALVGLTVDSVERDRQHVLLKVRRRQERQAPRRPRPPSHRGLRLTPTSTSEPLSQQVIDHTLRRLAAAGVSPRDGVMAHALRRIYGWTSPCAVSHCRSSTADGPRRPRTTSIDTVTDAEDLSAALAEAGAL